MHQAGLYCSRDIFQELHYCGLDSQCSIYNLTKFYLEQDGNKLLVAPHNGVIMCVGFQNTLPLSRPMSFTYIPADAEIMAIDSFNQSSGIFVVGILFVKVSRQRRESSGKSLTSFFNIYSEADITSETHLYKIDQGCKTLELGFVPYHLYHTDIYDKMSKTTAETVFLISGGDEKIHMFKFDGNGSGSYVEVEIENHFVEFSSLPGVVTRMQCLNLPGIERRLSVVGCKDGKVGVYLVDLFKNELLKNFTFEQNSMTTSVQIFSTFSYTVKNPPNISEFNVLVTSAFEEAFIARNAFEVGFASLTFLKDSDKYDCILCSLVGDIDFDGEMEILLGSYGQKLLVYKIVKPGHHHSPSSHKRAVTKSQPSSETGKKSTGEKPKLRISSAAQLGSLMPSKATFYSSSSVTSFPSYSADEGHPSSIDGDDWTFNSNSNLTLEKKTSSHSDSVFHPETTQTTATTTQPPKNFDYSLLTTRDFQDPIMGLDLVDLTSDAIDELVVMTMNGVHILQRSIDYMMDVFKDKLRSFRRARIGTGVVETAKPAKVDGSNNDDDDDDVSEKSFITKYE